MDTPRLKEAAKWLARGFALLVVAPQLLSFRLRSRLEGPDRAILGSSQLLSLIPGLPGQYLRRAFYSHALAEFDKTATVEFGTLFSQVGARIGARVYIGPMCHIGLADIEDDVLIAAAVHVPSGPRTHGIEDLSRPIREQPGERHRVRVGEGSWIGSKAVVMADVGRGCVVAAGSVVVESIPDLEIAAGSPARKVGHRGEKTMVSSAAADLGDRAPSAVRSP